MNVVRPLKTHFARLRELRFRRYDRCARIVRSLHRQRKRIDRHPQATQIWRVYDWLLTPLTLQAIDYPGLAEHIVESLEKGKEFDADLVLLLGLINDPPSERSQLLMMEAEHAVANGNYDGLAKEPQRYAELESGMKADTELRNYWNRFKSHYPRTLKPNTRGVIRRTLSRERGFDCRADFIWRKKSSRAQITFDALCYRWCLYGFEDDSPLLLKLTANPTPHGTMIFVPRRMSLAGHRAFVWRAIQRLHAAHGPMRQGSKLSGARMERVIKQQLARASDAEAKAQGLRGERRYQYSLAKLKMPPGSVRSLKRLLHDA